MQILSRETKRSDVRARLREACVLYAKEVSISGVGGRIKSNQERGFYVWGYTCVGKEDLGLFLTRFFFFSSSRRRRAYLGAADIFSKILQRFEDVEDTSG